MYHKSSFKPWIGNSLPKIGQAEGILNGNSSWGKFSIYNLFSAPLSELTHPLSSGGKPFIFAETGVKTDLFTMQNSNGYKFPIPIDDVERINVNNGAPASIVEESIPPAQFIPTVELSGEKRLLAKQIWWNQILNSTFLSTFPQIKAICFNENYKYQDGIYSDYGNFGDGPNRRGPNNFKPEGRQLVLEAFRNDVKIEFEDIINWADLKKKGIWDDFRTGYVQFEPSYVDVVVLFFPVLILLLAVIFSTSIVKTNLQ
jgi:hypothetical protein